MFKRTITSALIFGAAAIAPPTLSHAQSAQCMQRDALVERLQGQYGESLNGGGLKSASQLIEVWSSEKTGSFTVFITQANGVSCVVATGQNWNSSMAVAALEGVAS